MDPISAVGFAASIITFVDFASELVSGASELYKSPTGRSTKNTHIENIINDLQDVTDDLNTDSLGNSKEAKRLRRLALNCKRLAEELLGVLRRLRLDGNQNRPWKSLVVMWRNMRKADEVDSIEERLREYRSEMMLELCLMISNQQSSVCANLEIMKAEAVQLKSQTGRDLDSIKGQILQILKNTEHMKNPPTINSEIHTDILQLLHKLQQLNSKIPVQHRILRQLMYGSMHFREESIHDAESGTCKWILEGMNEILESEPIADEVDELKESRGDGSLTDELGVLNFSKSAADFNNSQPNIDHNMSNQTGDDITDVELIHEAITGRSVKNKNIYKNLQKRSQYLQKTARDQFRRWLRFGKGIFHICGKPGSGKSTLMKYIRSHPWTRLELEKWAGSKELVFACFYFSSNTTDESQMSLDSLYRSILFECLSQCPELISEVFPQQWRNFNASTRDSLLESNEFTKPKILDAFKTLISKRLNPRYRLCFFIDGLDEYHGDTYDHWKFAEMLRDWSSGNDLKICATSRPHTEYLDTFCPPHHVRILLQDLNEYDIYLFSRQLLGDGEKFPQIREDYLSLAAQLSKRSEGVFLWAVFAVRMLLTSVGYGDDPQTLMRNLDIIPEQLDELYEKLLASVSKHNRNQCNKFLCLTLMNPFNKPLNAVSYSWVNDLEDPGFPPPGASPYNEHEIILREKFVARQLDKLTKGLLEVVKTKMTISRRSASHTIYETQAWSSVQFLHRTFREFLQEKLQQDGFLQNFPGLTPGEIYGKIRIAEMSYRCTPNMAYDIGLRSVLIVNGMYMLSPAGNQSSNELLGLPPALAERLRLLCQETSFWAHCYRRVNCQNFAIRQAKNGSFIHLAAATGHWKYIIKLLEDDARVINPEYLDLSLELSALSGGYTSLASELLRKGGSVHRQISLHRTFPLLDDQISNNKTAPIWMVAVYMALNFEFRNVLGSVGNNSGSLRAIRFWEFIHQHVITSIDAPEGQCQVVIIDEKEIYVTLSNLLQMVAEYYSTSETSSYMNQECWQSLKRMSANPVQSSDYKFSQAPYGLMPADTSTVLSSLRNNRRVKFEIKFHDYIMNDKWCFRYY